MLFTIIRRSFFNQKRSMVLMIISVAVGTAVAASLVTLSLEISGKVSRELRAFGANIVVEPRVEGLADISGQKRYLREEDIIKAKTIFWRHNVVGVAPFLEDGAVLTSRGRSEGITLVGTWFERRLRLPGETGEFLAGIKSVAPWWTIDGQWPDLPDTVLAGASLAARLGIMKGDSILLGGRDFTVTGILDSGGNEDNQIIMNLESLQQFKGLHGKVSRAFVSALTTPMDEFAYKDPKAMSKREYEKWYCTGYVTSIAKQLEEVFQGSRAKPIWQIAETEGRVLDRLRLLIYSLCVMTLTASALGVSTTMIMSHLRRREEIGLMKAIGADRGKITAVFLSEALLIGLAGGLLGDGLSILTAQYIGIKVFGTGLEQRALLLPIAVGSALVISVGGTVLPLRRALKIKPAVVLKGAE